MIHNQCVAFSFGGGQSYLSTEAVRRLKQLSTDREVSVRVLEP